MDKETRTINEFIQKGNLSELSSEVDSIIRKIFSNGCTICCHYISDKSSYNSGPPPIIRIEMNDRNVPVQIIWDILHEYGHFLSGEQEKKGPKINRELLAWQYAKKELENYPKLRQMILEFEAYAEFCLRTYSHP